MTGYGLALNSRLRPKIMKKRIVFIAVSSIFLSACIADPYAEKSTMPNTVNGGRIGTTVSAGSKSSRPIENGFNSGDLTGFKCSGNCPVIDRKTASKADYSGNFILTPDMATPYRTEVTLSNHGVFNFGQDYWFSFRYNYIDWENDSSPESAPFQIHTKPGSWGKACKLGTAYSTAPFIMVTKDGEARFVTYGGKVLWSGPVQKNHWKKLVVHCRRSADDDGLVEAWIDGVNLGRVAGANSPKTDKCGQPMRDAYLKLGIYKWDWKRKKTDSTRRQLLIDDIKIMAGADGSALLTP
jgi:hypothetical protein